jgi:nitrate reductase gamma subunit
MLRWDQYGFDKNAMGHISQICVSASGGICGPRSAFGCVQGVKRRVGPVRIRQKSVGTRYAELVILHLVGSAGHLVNSFVSEEQNGDALFFLLVWLWFRFHEKCIGTR